MKAVIQWVIRTMMKDQTGVMQTLPKKDLVDFNAAMTAERLMRNGVDPNSLKNANQVENAINMIENKSNVRQEIKSTKSADIFELQMPPKKIDPKKGIMGGKQIPDDDLPPPGSRGGDDDIAAPFQSQEETLRNMTEAEIKANLEAQNKATIKKIKERKRPDVYTIDDYDTTNMSDIKKEIIRTETKLGNLNPNSPDFRERAKPLIDKIEALKNKMRDDKAQGGRAGFKIGSIDKARRAFLKAAAGVTGGIGALKTGLLGFGKEAAPTVEKVIEKVSTSDVPPYFLNLVSKIKNLGKKFDGPTERSESYVYKDYSMDIDLDTGKIDIKKTKEAMIPGGDEAGTVEEVYMTYKPGMADETTKGKKVVDEYEEFTARPDMEGKMKDVDGGVPDEVIKEGTMFEDNMTEFGKASGGIARMLGE